MKPVLLLIAIYSLIIHQSNKNANVAMPSKKPITKAISSQLNSSKKPITSPNFSYFNPAGISNGSVYAKWISKE